MGLQSDECFFNFLFLFFINNLTKCGFFMTTEGITSLEFLHLQALPTEHGV